jgi:hypothetical protein
VPVGGEMALNCAILSYNGFAYFGFSGDVHAAPDLHRMEALLKQSLAELTQVLGRKQPARHLKRKLKKRRPSPEPLTDVTPLQTVSKPSSTSTVSERPSPQHSITLTDEVLLAPVAAD